MEAGLCQPPSPLARSPARPALLVALSTRGHRGASSPQGARPLVIHETWAYARPGSVRSGHPAPLQAGKRVQSCPRPRARRGGGLVSHGAWGCLPRTTRPVKGLPRGLLLPPPPLGPISAPRCCHSGGRHHRGEMPGWVQGPGRCPALARHPSPPQPGSPKLGGSLGFLRWRRGRTRRTRRSFRPVHVLPEFGKKFQSSMASGK